MGNQFLDQYTLLHFASGVVEYFWGVPGFNWFLAHMAFELIENTEEGMRFINTKLTFWPGGKPKRDEFVNMLGDNISAGVGWWVASKLDETGKREGWYE